MTPEKIKSVLKGYQEDLASRGLEPCQSKEYGKPGSELSTEALLAHIAWMCREAQNLVEEGRTEKAFRWLGCIQGVLWAKGLYSLDQLKEHSRPRCPHCHGPVQDCQELRNYDMMWGEGDVVCKVTGKKIRSFDSG